MENCEWLINRVAYLRDLKSRSDQQNLLIFLAEKSDRSAQEIKKLTVLIHFQWASWKSKGDVLLSGL